MRHAFPFRLLRRSSAPLCLVLAAALAGGAGARAQLAITEIGYTGMDATGGGNVTFLGTGASTNRALVIPFQFDASGETESAFTVSSISLKLSGAGVNLGDLSVLVSATLPTDETVPSALATFSATGALTATGAVYAFTPDSAGILTTGTTYYLRIANASAFNANWVFADSAYISSGSGSGGGGGSVNDASFSTLFVNAVLGNVDSSPFRTISFCGGGGYSNVLEVAGGFSLTAAAVPEPAANTMIAAAGALLTAMLVRRFRRR